jgi:hypothetical protein
MIKSLFTADAPPPDNMKKMKGSGKVHKTSTRKYVYGSTLYVSERLYLAEASVKFLNQTFGAWLPTEH